MPRRRRGWALDHYDEQKIYHTPLTVSLLEPALLILIKRQARHGYTLLSDLEMLGMGTIHPSVVYRTLREMEELGWIDSEWTTDQTQGPPRRTYRITAEGDVALVNWQQELKKSERLIAKLLQSVDS